MGSIDYRTYRYEEIDRFAVKETMENHLNWKSGELFASGFRAAISDLYDEAVTLRDWPRVATKMLTEESDFVDLHADNPKPEKLKMDQLIVGDWWGRGYLKALRLAAEGHHPVH